MSFVPWEGISHLLDFPFDDLRQLGQHWEVRQDADEHDERIPDLHVVARIQAHHHRLRDLVVPLVAHVPAEYIHTMLYVRGLL